MPVEIREITSEESAHYKQFFIAGLIHDEEAFRISPEDEINAPFPTSDKADSFTLGAYENKILIGVVSFQRDGHNREKLRHKGLIFRMYVAPYARRKGIGNLLMQELLKRIRQIKGIEIVWLTVLSHNDAAKSLYKKYGFRIFSVELNAIKWKRKYFNESSMALELPHFY
ncbi:GNAT family N-acetyltransferase [bacterium]|nr:GNAT family N-acetyltransferase [bacterium]